jgi:hypothetical protein
MSCTIFALHLKLGFTEFGLHVDFHFLILVDTVNLFSFLLEERIRNFEANVKPVFSHIAARCPDWFLPFQGFRVCRI